MEFTVLAMNSAGKIVRGVDPAPVQRFAEVHPFAQMCAIHFSVGQELSGRIFLLEPHFISSIDDELRFLQELVRQISPAVYNLYLLRRLRRRAGALERARLVRELHDGAVQSLIGVEMQVDVLRRNYNGHSEEHSATANRSELMATELERIDTDAAWSRWLHGQFFRYLITTRFAAAPVMTRSMLSPVITILWTAGMEMIRWISGGPSPAAERCSAGLETTRWRAVFRARCARCTAGRVTMS